MVFKGVRTGFKWSSVLLLIEYVFLVFCSTVIFRPTGETRQYDFHPFWSYDRPELLVENIMNVIVFIPIGMILGSLLRVTFGSGFRVQGSWLIVLLIGCSISITVEALQFWFMKGFSEVDDVMVNDHFSVRSFKI
jgi:glycopeptide antibiotics resistance protein